MSADDDALLDDVAGFTHDPLGHALYAYEWGKGELNGEAGPREWQAQEMDALGAHLRNPATRFTPYRAAIASGHGVGKSAFVSMISKWALDTCVDTKIVITANTEGQLRIKTWPELIKWHRLSITRDWFKVTATSLASTDGDHEKEWRADAVPWSETNTEAFAGLHNKGKRIVLIMDEASAIADKVWEVAEGAMTDANTEIIFLVFGNPTRATGKFRECFRENRARWRVKQIDSRTVEGVNKEELDRWVEEYGEDSDFVKVRVRGMFPSLTAKQFISEADVDGAWDKHLKPEQYDWAPKILTLDPAWEGDDKLVIGLRQGLRFQVLLKMQKNDNDVHIANVLARLEDEHQADAVFVDGGYGTGIVSVGRTLSRDWTLVWFSGKSADPGCLNKRAEMWLGIKIWLKEGGAIEPDQELRDDLIGPETVPRMDGKLQIEAKDTMKRRGLPSPNCGDALALSFAYPVAMKRTREDIMVENMAARKEVEYDSTERWLADLG